MSFSEDLKNQNFWFYMQKERLFNKPEYDFSSLSQDCFSNEELEEFKKGNKAPIIAKLKKFAGMCYYELSLVDVLERKLYEDGKINTEKYINKKLAFVTFKYNMRARFGFYITPSEYESEYIVNEENAQTMMSEFEYITRYSIFMCNMFEENILKETNTNLDFFCYNAEAIIDFYKGNVKNVIALLLACVDSYHRNMLKLDNLSEKIEKVKKEGKENILLRCRVDIANLQRKDKNHCDYKNVCFSDIYEAANELNDWLYYIHKISVLIHFAELNLF